MPCVLDQFWGGDASTWVAPERAPTPYPCTRRHEGVVRRLPFVRCQFCSLSLSLHRGRGSRGDVIWSTCAGLLCAVLLA